MKKTQYVILSFILSGLICLLGCSQKEERHYYVTAVHHPHTEEPAEWGHMLGWVETYAGEVINDQVVWFGDESPIYAMCKRSETGRYEWYINNDAYDNLNNPPLTVFRDRYLLYKREEDEWVEIPVKFTGEMGASQLSPGTETTKPLGPEKVLNQSALDTGIYRLCFYIAPFLPGQEELRDEWWYLTVDFYLHWD